MASHVCGLQQATILCWWKLIWCVLTLISEQNSSTYKQSLIVHHVSCFLSSMSSISSCSSTSILNVASGENQTDASTPWENGQSNSSCCWKLVVEEHWVKKQSMWVFCLCVNDWRKILVKRYNIPVARHDYHPLAEAIRLYWSIHNSEISVFQIKMAKDF